ncbi:MAG: aldo/keto reductase [Actinomycetota bacterium]|nr:aldo/keto reductase [Actinomycetota bacterium]
MQFVQVQGEQVPALGLGTWLLRGDDCRRAVREALEVGYRHFDTAQMYGNEDAIGRVLRSNMVVDRDQLFITTKLNNRNHAPRDVLASTDDSLRRLGIGYVDLLLVHWPVAFEALPATLEAMVKLRDDGKARNLGVSNFTTEQVETARRHAPIFCNQVEYHPFLAQPDQLALARDRGLLLTAYCPLARGQVAHDPTLNEIGRRHHKTAAQVALRWLVDQEPVAAVPKASSRQHLEENLAIFDFELTDEDRDEIAALDRGERLIDPPFAPAWER